MALKYRLSICALLAVTAAFCASYTIADLRQPPEQLPRKSVETVPEEHFALCARDGCVAVLDPALGNAAVVTDIRLETLREADRELVERGILVDSREALLSLLEDLGS